MKSTLIALSAALSLSGCAATSAQTSTPPPAPEFQRHYHRVPAQPNAASNGDKAIAPQEDIFFAFDSAELTPAALETLDAVAQWLREHPGERVVIEGRADRIGDATYNLELSKQRALAVEGHLYARGVETERIDIVAKGENATLDAPHPVNRRVIVYVATDDAALSAKIEHAQRTVAQR